MKKLVVNITTIISLIALFYMSVVYRTEISNGVINSISFCLYSLIPTLFPTMFLASVAVFSPINSFVSKRLSKFFTSVFKISPAFIFPFILSLFCGYPVGAKLCSILHTDKKVTDNDCKHFLLFAVTPGISFPMLFVGDILLNNIYIGLYFFIATSMASVTLALFLSIKRAKPSNKYLKEYDYPLLTNINLSLKSTLSAVTNMCMYYILFSSFIPLLHSTGFFQWLVSVLSNITLFTPMEYASMLKSFPDIISGVISTHDLMVSPIYYLVGLSFAGLCVHFQVFSLFDKKSLNKIHFYIFRILHIVISIIIYKILMHFFPIAINTSSNFDNHTVFLTQTSIGASVIMLCLCFIFIFCSQSTNKR